MRLPSLLLLSLLVPVQLAATDTVQPAPPPAPIQTTDALAAPVAGAQQLFTPEQKADFASEPDGICYKIRAYIFKRDDDHAPELTGSTTCGPRQPRAKNVVSPKARLVPAD